MPFSMTVRAADAPTAATAPTRELSAFLRAEVFSPVDRGTAFLTEHFLFHLVIISRRSTSGDGGPRGQLQLSCSVAVHEEHAPSREPEPPPPPSAESIEDAAEVALL